MPRGRKRNNQEARLERARKHINAARAALGRSILGPLSAHAEIRECGNDPSEPIIACVDPAQGAIWLNPHHRHELGTAEWTFILGHELLHLGLSHAKRRLDRDPLLWNLACDIAADNLLYSFKLGRAPHDFAVDTSFAGVREEEIYISLVDDRRLAGKI